MTRGSPQSDGPNLPEEERQIALVCHQTYPKKKDKFRCRIPRVCSMWSKKRHNLHGFGSKTSLSDLPLELRQITLQNSQSLFNVVDRLNLRRKTNCADLSSTLRYQTHPKKKDKLRWFVKTSLSDLPEEERQIALDHQDFVIRLTLRRKTNWAGSSSRLQNSHSLFNVVVRLPKVTKEFRYPPQARNKADFQ